MATTAKILPRSSVRHTFSADSLFNAMREAVVVAPLESREIVYWNGGAESMFGYTSEDAMGKGLDLIFPAPGSYERFFQQALPAVRRQRSWCAQWELRRSDGSLFPAEVSTTTQAQAGNGPYAVLVTRELVERKRIESDGKFHIRRQAAIAQLGQDALTGLPIPVLMSRAVTLVTKCLDVEFCEILELQPDEKTLLLRAGKGWKKGLVEHATVGVKTASQAGYTLLADQPVIVRNLVKEQRFRASPLFLEYGVKSGATVIIHGGAHPYGVIGAHTSRARVFRRQDIDLLRSFAHIIAAAIGRNRVESALRQVNTSLNKSVVERTRLIQLLQAVTVVANEAETVDAALTYAIDYVCRHLAWPVGHAYKAMDGPGRRLASMGYWYLGDSDRFRSFVKASEDATCEPGIGCVGRVLADHKVLWIQDTRDKVFLRAAAAEAAGLTTGLILPVLVKKKVVAVLEFFTTEPRPFDEQLVDVMEQIGVQLGRVVERKEAEQVLRRSHYLSTLGRAAAKVAHEISNPLNGMYTAVQLLERTERARNEEVVATTVRDLKSEITRLRSLLQDFRSLSKPMKFYFEPCNLAGLVREMLHIYGPQYEGQGIQVKCDLADELPEVQVDKEKLKQALLNLNQNAVDAMSGSGRLTIRGYQSWDSVCLEIEDTGGGMPEGVDFFEEFSTTKSGGTGLGLPIVQQIISGHHGTLGYTSQRGRGTTFRITLPIHSKT